VQTKFEHEVAYLIGRRYHVSISKTGGGTVGRRYDGDWSYAIRSQNYRGKLLMFGSDLSTGNPSTHREAAELAVEMYEGI